MTVPLTVPPAAGTEISPKEHLGAVGQQGGEKVRHASGAGIWYPADSSHLRETVDAYLAANPSSIREKPVVLIVPHAGYDYSGPVAGATYATLTGHTYKRVLILGLSHGAPLHGASVLEVDAYETPLGRIPVNAEARDALLDCPVVTGQPDAHLNEHSVENQLPMLQRALPDFEMVGVLVGVMTEDERTTLAQVIRTLLDEETLLVVSTDFTHYGADYGYVPFQDDVPERLQMLHAAAVQEILEVDVPGWDGFLHNTQATICGRNAVALLLETLQPFDDIEGRSIAYALSGDMTGDFTNSVTYSGLGFWRFASGLNESEQRMLLRVSRDAVRNYLDRGTEPTVDVRQYELTPRLESLGAAFVTLRNAGELRGCIGDVVAMKQLFQRMHGRIRKRRSTGSRRRCLARKNSAPRHPPVKGIRGTFSGSAGSLPEWVVSVVPRTTNLWRKSRCGSSGALGSSFHAPSIADVYSDARVEQMGDAAGGYRGDAVPSTLQTWGNPALLPDWPEYADPDATDFETFYVAAGRHTPNLRLSQINFHADEVQLSFLRLEGVDGVPLVELLDANLEEISEALPTFRSYMIQGDTHGIVRTDDFYQTEVDGVRLQDWLAGLIAGEEIATVTCEECR